jgi:hypothetical protein
MNWNTEQWKYSSHRSPVSMILLLLLRTFDRITSDHRMLLRTLFYTKHFIAFHLNNQDSRKKCLYSKIRLDPL